MHGSLLLCEGNEKRILLFRHIPSRTLASFAKRLARLALRAGPADARVLLLLISNLMRRHPPVRCLLHREKTAAEDSFQAESNDPEASGALESSLFELEPLTAHWEPGVAALAKRLLASTPEEKVMEKDPQKELAQAEEVSACWAEVAQ